MEIIPDEIIDDALKRFRNEFGVEATPQAGRLIRELLNTILNDPDPRWQPRERARSLSEREQVVNKLIANLPGILLTIAQEEETGQEITASDVLHWLGVKKMPPKLHTFGFVFDKK